MTAASHGVGVGDWLSLASTTPDAVTDEGWVALLAAEDADLDALRRAADRIRHERVGDAITFAVNRNLETAAALADRELLASLLDEAWELGATEICMQGPLPVDAPASGYIDLVEAIIGRQPDLHLHAFRPAEVLDGAARLSQSPREFLTRAQQSGLGSVPGTGARILDDPIRAALTGGADIPAARWIELISTAHEVGLKSTATMVYGHIESPAQQVAHLRALARVQAATGGFSELILMPIRPEQVPLALTATVRFPDARETRALHAVARLLLAGQIDHIQAAWPSLGLELARELLRGGADDIGGILLDGTLAPGAGPEAGNTLDLAAVAGLAASLDRPVRQRTTLYGDPGPERVTVGR